MRLRKTCKRLCNYHNPSHDDGCTSRGSSTESGGTLDNICLFDITVYKRLSGLVGKGNGAELSITTSLSYISHIEYKKKQKTNKQKKFQ